MLKAPYTADGTQICLNGSNYGLTVAKNGTGLAMNPQYYRGTGSSYINSNDGGYANSYANKVLSGQVLQLFPSYWRGYLFNAYWVTNTAPTTTTIVGVGNQIALPAEYEIYGVNTCGNLIESDHLVQYPAYANGLTPIHGKLGNVRVAAYVWLRTSCRFNSANFCLTGNAGNESTHGPASFDYGVAPVFVIAAI